MTYKIYSETTDTKSYDIKDCSDTDKANILKCQVCFKFPSDPVMSKKCGHIFCKTCFINFKASVKTSICPGSGRNDCDVKVTIDDMEPLTGIVKALYSTIHISCK